MGKEGNGMKVLLMGAGGVGESYAAIVKERGEKSDWLTKLVIADYNFEQAQNVVTRLNDDRFIAEQIDATKEELVYELVKKHECDIIVSALDAVPFNLILMRVALKAECHYMDFGLVPCERDPEDATKLLQLPGDPQFAMNEEFEKKNLFALCACGVEPGMIDYFARYAEKYYFDEIEELHVRDGSNLECEDSEIGFGFSIYQTISECAKGPIYWERGKGFYSEEPLSSPEEFYLPKGIGNVRMVGIKHSEPINMARNISKDTLKKTSFKIGFGEEFEVAMKNLQELGLTSDEKVLVDGVMVSPLKLVGASAKSPKDVGKTMKGATCAGLWVKGIYKGLRREIYMYQVADNKETLERLGTSAVVAQTAVTPVIVTEVLARGELDGRFGTRVSEEFNPDPVLKLLKEYNFPAGIMEMDSPYREKLEEEAFLEHLE